MKSTGWEMQPLGWILLIVGVTVMCVLVAEWIRPTRPKAETEA